MCWHNFAYQFDLEEKVDKRNEKDEPEMHSEKWIF